MEEGVVQSFDAINGTGFIRPADESNDLFFNFSEVQTAGGVSLEEGQMVSFEIGQSKQGECAVNVTFD